MALIHRAGLNGCLVRHLSMPSFRAAWPLQSQVSTMKTASTKAASRVAFESWDSAAMDVNSARTLPASYYTDARVLKLEEESIFRKHWQMVGFAHQASSPGQYFCGRLMSLPYVVVRDQDNKLRAFHNVCRHHAAAVATGCGAAERFTCPYHGWTYALDGRLMKAPRLKGIRDFRAGDNGLHPLRVQQWGPLIFLHFGAAPDGPDNTPSVEQWLGRGGEAMVAGGAHDELCHVARREYVVDCNWKVYADNYLDGGYHVPVAHPGLAAELDLDSYSHELHEVLSLQRAAPTRPTGARAPQTAAAAASHSGSSEGTSGSSGGGGGSSDSGRSASGGSSGDATDAVPPSCGPAVSQRLDGGPPAMYAFVYPNLMLNRYGPLMDVNVVTPLAPACVDRCRVTFDWFAAPERAADPAFVSAAVAASDVVQREDEGLCAAVQTGLSSPAYGAGRYAPSLEAPMFHFHQMLYRDLLRGVERLA